MNETTIYGKHFFRREILIEISAHNALPEKLSLTVK
jgi:hypothetical protein